MRIEESVSFCVAILFRESVETVRTISEEGPRGHMCTQSHVVHTRKDYYFHVANTHLSLSGLCSDGWTFPRLSLPRGKLLRTGTYLVLSKLVNGEMIYVNVSFPFNSINAIACSFHDFIPLMAYLDTWNVSRVGYCRPRMIYDLRIRI